MRHSVKPGKTHTFNIEDKSSVYLIDELGEPLADTAVEVELEDGRTLKLHTDSNGCLKRVLREGEIKALLVDDAHEADLGEGIKTESGQHFTR